MNKSSERENFKSRIGFLLVAAGCAIGIGNVWRFPYITGQNGGALFVLLYLVCLLVFGVPILTMELAVGRASRKSALPGLRQLEKPGSFWHLHGWTCLAGCLILMMYYTTVSGWMLGYCVKYAGGTFSGLQGEAVKVVFEKMLASPGEMTLWMGLMVLAGFLVCSLGLSKGVEAVSKVLMTGLLVLILVLAVRSVSLPGAKEGLRFYLYPSLANAAQAGFWNVLTAALSQAFFTLSVGIGSMEIFGSYMSKKHTLTTESLYICVLDTFVAISAGLIIFPACFNFGVNPDAGPNLIFLTLPHVFSQMPGGSFWGMLFFLFMTFASFSTVFAVFEMLIASCMDVFGWSRKKAVLWNGVTILLLSMPCVLGFNVLSHIQLLPGKNILDVEDFIVSQLLLPGGALIYLLFCVTRFGWGFDSYLTETNTGSGIRLPRASRHFFRWVLPVIILVVFGTGLYSTLKG